MNCACCDKKMKWAHEESPDGLLFCSIECACYSGRFSVRRGWINSEKPPERHPPKKPPLGTGEPTSL